MDQSHLNEMPHSDNSETTTEQLIQKLKLIQEQQEVAKHERHKANNQLMDTVGRFSLNQIKQQDQILEMRESLSEIKHDIRLLRDRLVGDDTMQSEGLVDEVRSLQEWKTNVGEKAVKDLEFVKRMGALFGALVTLAGGIITIYVTLFRK